jgi:hypothetical protein
MELCVLCVSVCVCVRIYDYFLILFINHKPITKGHSPINGQVFEDRDVFSCTVAVS